MAKTYVKLQQRAVSRMPAPTGTLTNPTTPTSSVGQPYAPTPSTGQSANFTTLGPSPGGGNFAMTIPEGAQAGALERKRQVDWADRTLADTSQPLAKRPPVRQIDSAKRIVADDAAMGSLGTGRHAALIAPETPEERKERLVNTAEAMRKQVQSAPKPPSMATPQKNLRTRK